MARFRLKQTINGEATFRDVGLAVQDILRLPASEQERVFRNDLNDRLSHLVDIPPGVSVRAVRDGEFLKHVIIPFYRPGEGPHEKEADLWGQIVVRGCSD
jgi:hypothetical protein